MGYPDGMPGGPSQTPAQRPPNLSDPLGPVTTVPVAPQNFSERKAQNISEHFL